MRMRVGWVTAGLQFQRYKADYELTYIELNRKKE